MKFKESVGIDVSKSTIDVVLHNKKVSCQFDNTLNGFKSCLKWCEKHAQLEFNQLLICFEHTGLYSHRLATYLSEQQITFCMVAALQIKRSLGIVRGKDDQIDAQRIAEYAWLRREQIQPYKMPSKDLFKLQKLLSLRGKLVKQKADYLGSIKEYKAILKQSEYQLLFKTHKKMIAYLEKQVLALEKEITAIIQADEQMNRLFSLITSVKGVGLILAANLLVATNCFSSFKDGRKFACYSGIAPFRKQSGSSLKSKPKVSHYANKRMKSLLNLAASSAILADPELKAYYQRRVESGKSKMSTLNIVRNKIVHRVFAVVRRGTPYVPLHKHAA